MIFPDEVQLFLQFRDIATKEQAYQAKVVGNLYGYQEVRSFVKKCIDENKDIDISKISNSKFEEWKSRFIEKNGDIK